MIDPRDFARELIYTDAGGEMADRSKREAWIETTHSSVDQRTLWRVVVDGAVVQEGDVESADPTGSLAYEIAESWIEDKRLAVAGWKHALDRPELQQIRARTKSEDRSPLRFTGWLHCEMGGREAVSVTAAQLRSLDGRELPCPVCGEACGAKLEPSVDVGEHALVWNGARWHSH